MRYLSLFSGIEAASVAWEPLGWQPVAFSEIESFPCAVLAQHWPHVPNLGDVTKIEMRDIKKLGPIDIVIFGSPCQDLSVAGKRKGLAGERSGLFGSAMRIVRWARKHNGLRFALWENVPGAFSTNSGRDFSAVVREMSGADIGVPSGGWQNCGVALGREGQTEWSVLDAQFFGVPQRRRRIFALSDFGNWRDRPPILFERDSLCGNPAPRRKKGEEFASSAERSTVYENHPNDSRVTEVNIGPTVTQRFGTGGGNVPLVASHDPAATLQTTCGEWSRDDCPNVIGTYRKSRRAQSTTDHESWVEDDVANTINTFDVGDVRSTNAVAFTASERSNSYAWESEVNPTLNSQIPNDTSNLQYGIRQEMQVRRLTPVECARLQGFPDDHLDISYRNKPAPDGAKYKALGNSMAVPVVRWIGEQIESNCPNYKKTA